MGRLIRSVGAFFAALLSMGLTVAFILLLDRLTGFNLFTLMWWFVIPLGAFVTGLLAAWGYHFGAVRLQVKPTKALAAAVPAVALLAQALLYYVQYATAVLEDGRPVADLVGFIPFTGWSLTHAHYGVMVHSIQVGEGMEVGFLGYLVAFLQFIALAAGGFFVYALLADRPYCDRCGRYLSRIAARQWGFSGGKATWESLQRLEPPSGAYFEALDGLPKGHDLVLDQELWRCGGCAGEALGEKPTVYKDGKPDYFSGVAPRKVWIPAKNSIAERFRAQDGAPMGAKG